MNLIEAIKAVKENLYLLLIELSKDARSLRVQLCWVSCAGFLYSIIQAPQASTAAASVLIACITGYIGSNTAFYLKQTQQSKKEDTDNASD